MNKWLTRAVGTAGLAGGFLLLTATQAQAATPDRLPANDLLPLSGLQDDGGLPLLSDLLGSAKSPNSADLLGPSGSGLFGADGPAGLLGGGNPSNGLFDDDGPAGLLGGDGLSGLFGGRDRSAGQRPAQRPASAPAGKPAARPVSKPPSLPASPAAKPASPAAKPVSPAAKPVSEPVSDPVSGSASQPFAGSVSAPAVNPGSAPAGTPGSVPVADVPVDPAPVDPAPVDQPASVPSMIPNPAAQFLGIDGDYMPALIGNTLAAQRPELFGDSGGGGGLLGALTGRSRQSESPTQGLAALPGLTMLSTLAGPPAGAGPATERPTVTRGGDRPAATRPAGEQPNSTRAAGTRPTTTRAAADQPASAQVNGDRPTKTRAAGERPGATRTTAEQPAGVRATGERPAGNRATGQRPAAGQVTDRPATTVRPGRHRAQPDAGTRTPPAQTSPRGSGAHRADDAPKKGPATDPGRGGGTLAGHPANTWAAVAPSDDGAIIVTPGSDQGFGRPTGSRAPRAVPTRAPRTTPSQASHAIPATAAQAAPPKAAPAKAAPAKAAPATPPKASRAVPSSAARAIPPTAARAVAPQVENPHPAESPSASPARDRPTERPGERPVAGIDPDFS